MNYSLERCDIFTVGNEIDGRDAATVGGAPGAAVGTAINTEKQHHQPDSYSPRGIGSVRPDRRKKGVADSHI
jgi:hypothetical protein